jgi:hypothetical protein
LPPTVCYGDGADGRFRFAFGAQIEIAGSSIGADGRHQSEVTKSTIEEIEVTPEMIEAGVDEITGYYLSLDGGDPTGSIYPEIVGRIFARMEEARRRLAV